MVGASQAKPWALLTALLTELLWDECGFWSVSRRTRSPTGGFCPGRTSEVIDAGNEVLVSSSELPRTRLLYLPDAMFSKIISRTAVHATGAFSFSASRCVRSEYLFNPSSDVIPSNSHSRPT